MNIVKVVIDANTVIHFKWTQFDWVKTFNGDAVELVVTRIFLEEIDKLKKSDQRARNFYTKYIKQFRSTPIVYIKQNVHLVFESISVEGRAYDGVNDNLLIEYALKVKSKYPQNRIVLCTDDSYALLISREDIEVFTIPEDYLHPLEDKVAKENHQLKQKLAKIENSLPKLTLVFDSEDKDRIYLQKPVPFNKDTINIDRKLEEARKSFKEYKTQSEREAEKKLRRTNNPLITDIVGQVWMAASLMRESLLSDTRVLQYREEIDKYIEKYRSYLKELPSIENQRSLRFTLSFYIKNSGTCPATDCKINIHVPNGVEVYKLGYAPKLSREPEKPRDPTDTYSHARDFLHISDLSLNQRVPNVGSGILRKTNSYKCTWPVSKIQHDDKLHLEDLIFIFDSFENVKSFNINYNIICDEIPEKAQGELHIIFE